jgi:FtsH-binding integral membrane protein
MSDAKRCGKRGQDQLGWGLFMIVMGVWFLLIQQGVLGREAWHTWWPFVVVALGVLGIATARDVKSLGSGVTTLFIGLWLAATVHEWYGLRWSNSWPLALVAMGLGTLVEWAAAVVAARRHKEDGHVG